MVVYPSCWHSQPQLPLEIAQYKGMWYVQNRYTFKYHMSSSSFELFKKLCRQVTVLCLCCVGHRAVPRLSFHSKNIATRSDAPRITNITFGFSKHRLIHYGILTVPRAASKFRETWRFTNSQMIRDPPNSFFGFWNNYDTVIF